MIIAHTMLSINIMIVFDNPFYILIHHIFDHPSPKRLPIHFRFLLPNQKANVTKPHKIQGLFAARKNSGDLQNQGRSPVNDQTNKLHYQLKLFTVNYSKILKENFISKGFSFPGYMKHFIKTHLCLKITINGLFRQFIGHAAHVYCSVGLIPKILQFCKNLKSITRFKIL